MVSANEWLTWISKMTAIDFFDGRDTEGVEYWGGMYVLPLAFCAECPTSLRNVEDTNIGYLEEEVAVWDSQPGIDCCEEIRDLRDFALATLTACRVRCSIARRRQTPRRMGK